MRKIISIGFLSILLAGIQSPSIADSPEAIQSNRVSAPLGGPGPGGYTRLLFGQEIGTFNYSVQPTELNGSYVSVLPPCVSKSSTECIESLEYRLNPDSNWESAVLQTRTNPSMDGVVAFRWRNGVNQFYGPVSPDPNIFRPAGSTSRTWKMKGAPHAGGDEYLLSVTVSDLDDTGRKNQWQSLSITLRAIKWVTPPPFGKWDKTENSITEFNTPLNVEFRVSINLGMLDGKIGSWYNGRLSNPKITRLDKKLIISAAPASVPIAGTNYFTCTSLEGNQKEYFLYHSGRETFFSGPMCNDPLGSTLNTSSADVDAFEAFELWEKSLFEFGKNTYWSLEASSNLDSSCKSSDVSGFVSSNALVYTKNPPYFNPRTSQLSYRIASTHLDKNGQLNKGQFHLVLKESVAECLWRLDPNNLASAEVQVVYGDGTPIVGTSTFKTENGWVYISIDNFTFSSPTFAVTMKNSSSQNQAAKSATQAKKKKSTITCIKGKVSKKITSIDPKCPVGYKKK